jgi:copper homeostasis protein
VTFHKAIDQAGDPLELLDALMTIGADRVLTSGGRPTALEGVAALKTLVDRAGDRIAVMAGGRLRLENLDPIIRRTQVVEVHLGSAVVRHVPGPEPSRAADGSETSWSRVDAQRVAAVVAQVQGMVGTS